MATPRSKYTGMTATLATRLRSSSADTSFDAVVTSSDPWSSVTNGTLKLNRGASQEWVNFTGITVNSSTSITFTGCTRGMDKDATTQTDGSAANRKDHPISTVIKYVLHSVDINTYLQKDADQTLGGNLTFTGANVFSSTTVPTLRLQEVTEVQRDALTAVESAIVRNLTSGTVDVYLGGAWVQFGGTTVTTNATETVAGKVELATTAQQIAMTEFGETGASLMVPNKSTERLLNGMHNSTATALQLGANNTGNRLTELRFISDATYTSGALAIARAASGANSDSTILHRGTGTLVINANEGGAIGHNTSFCKSYTLGETLVNGDVVYYKTSDNRVWKANRTAVASGNVLGIIKVGGVAGGTGYVQETPGSVTGLSGITAGNSYYQSGTAGAMTATVPAMNSATVVPFYMGKGITTTGIQFSPMRMARRRFGAGSIAAGVTTQTIIAALFPVSYVVVHFTTTNYPVAGTDQGNAGYGYFDNTIATQQAITGYGNQTGVSIYLLDLIDGVGSKTGTISVDGSNNVLISWAETNYSNTNPVLYYMYEIYEQL